MSKAIRIEVDGRTVETHAGAVLLDILRKQGKHIPTLCHHPSLDSSGACRLCAVEITHPDWRGWSDLVTSCLYPAKDGMQIFTHSKRVIENRRTLLELYLARCPESEAVQAVAHAEGVDLTPFAVEANANLCIQCGLCTRVCQDLGPSAIAPLGRGTDKGVGPRPDMVGEECTGCLACEYVCPTGEISSHLKDGTITIWKRDFPVPLCTVEAERCIGCGACEEVCSLAIPRVVTTRDGSLRATISSLTCVGCGNCAGVCPTAAIHQESFPNSALTGTKPNLKGQTLTYACSRSSFPAGTEGVVSVPCIGRVPVEVMLESLALGADGIQLMCRDRETCPHALGGELGEKRVSVAENLAVAAGLGAGRIQYVKPPYGPKGPRKALDQFKATLSPSPLRETYSTTKNQVLGLDRAMDILAWLRAQPELEPVLPPSVEVLFDRSRGEKRVPLYLGDLADLDRLLSTLVSGWRLKDYLEATVEKLRRAGIDVYGVLTPREIEQSGARRVLVFSRDNVPAFAGNPELLTVDEALGLTNAEIAVTPILSGDGFRFQITQEERRQLLGTRDTEVTPLECENPYELAQVKLLKRSGAWRTTHLSNTPKNLSHPQTDGGGGAE
jgi:bidirectional [NiFe] hydrogenase diaphorase subunit